MNNEIPLEEYHLIRERRTSATDQQLRRDGENNQQQSRHIMSTQTAGSPILREIDC